MKKEKTNDITINLTLSLSEEQLETTLGQIIQPIIARAFAQAEENVKKEKPLNELTSGRRMKEYLGVNDTKFRKFIQNGLPQTEVINGEIMYRPRKVFEFLDRHTTSL